MSAAVSDINVNEKTALLCVEVQHQNYHQHQQQHIITVPASASASVKDRAEYETTFFTADLYSHGLSLEELLQYVDDPKWQLLRRVLFSCVLLTLMLTFIVACWLAHKSLDLCSTANANKTTMTALIYTPTASARELIGMSAVLLGAT